MATGPVDLAAVRLTSLIGIAAAFLSQHRLEFRHARLRLRETCFRRLPRTLGFPVPAFGLVRVARGAGN